MIDVLLFAVARALNDAAVFRIAPRTHVLHGRNPPVEPRERKVHEVLVVVTEWCHERDFQVNPPSYWCPSNAAPENRLLPMSSTAGATGVVVMDIEPS